MLQDLLGDDLWTGDIVAFALDKEKLVYAVVQKLNDDNSITLRVFTEHSDYDSRIYVPNVSVIRIDLQYTDLGTLKDRITYYRDHLLRSS